jgi:hypothetical protein
VEASTAVEEDSAEEEAPKAVTVARVVEEPEERVGMVEG